MRHRRSDYLIEPIGRARDQIQSMVQERPRRTIGGFLLVAALVGLAIWGWPELRRTIHMHRM